MLPLGFLHIPLVLNQTLWVDPSTSRKCFGIGSLSRSGSIERFYFKMKKDTVKCLSSKSSDVTGNKVEPELVTTRLRTHPV